MNKTYSRNEFAKAMGVSKATVCNWIKSGLVHPKRTEVGQEYFTESQVAMAIMDIKLNARNVDNSTLYLIVEPDDEKAQKKIEVAYDTQKKLYPNSLFIENFATFFISSLKNNSENIKNGLDKNVIKGQLLKELNKKLNNYVNDKVISLIQTDERYEDFKVAELKDLILGTASDELIIRFNKVADEIAEKPSKEQSTMKGEIKLNATISYSYLNILIKDKVSRLAKELGLADSRILDTNYKQLLNLERVIDKETFDLLAAEDFEINMDASGAKEIIKHISYKNERMIARKQSTELNNKGFYYIMRYYDNEQCLMDLYNYLDSKTFKKIIQIGEANLPREIELKIKLGKEKGTFAYEVFGDK